MQIKYSPQCSNKTIAYQFQGEKVIATLNGEQQTIDLSNISQYPQFDENEQQAVKLPFLFCRLERMKELRKSNS
jgi:hypothetical protein